MYHDSMYVCIMTLCMYVSCLYVCMYHGFMYHTSYHGSMYACMYICMYRSMHTHIRAYHDSMYVCMHACIYVCIKACTHTHTHTRSYNNPSNKNTFWYHQTQTLWRLSSVTHTVKATHVHTYLLPFLKIQSTILSHNRRLLPPQHMTVVTYNHHCTPSGPH